MFRFAERQMVERTLPSLRHRLYSSTGGDPPGSEFVDRKRRIVAAPGHTHLRLRMHILSVDYRLILSAETGFSLTHPRCGRRWTPCLQSLRLLVVLQPGACVACVRVLAAAPLTRRAQRKGLT